MIKEVIGEGNSVEEAKENALAQIGNPIENFKIEIMEEFKPKILGLFGGKLAKVKVIYEEENKKANRKEKSKAKKNNITKPKADDTKAVKETAKDKEANEDAKELEEVVIDYKPVSDFADDAVIVNSVDYLKDILGRLGQEDVDIKVAKFAGKFYFSVEGGDSGFIIGHRGELLDALQTLVIFSLGNSKKSNYRFVIDTANYRNKRKAVIKDMVAKRVADVQRTHKSRSLPPMGAYERRLVHIMVRTMEGLESKSVGEKNNRHVVIFPEGGSARPNNGGYRNGGNRRGGRRSNGGSKSNVVASPNRPPMSDFEEDAPMYGKIK